MRVYISDIDRDSQVVKLVADMGHEVIFPNNSGDGKINEGHSRKVIAEADVAVFPLATKDKMGIMDYLSAFSLGIPCISLVGDGHERKNISANIGIMSEIVAYSSPEELKIALKEFFDEVSCRNLEGNLRASFIERR